MPQIIDPLPANDSDSMVCCYLNASSKIQVARITNIPNWYFERVVFPGQQLLFESVPEAQLEIHTGSMASAMQSDTIPCYRLRLHQSVSASQQYLRHEQGTQEQVDVAQALNMVEFPKEAAKVS